MESEVLEFTPNQATQCFWIWWWWWVAVPVVVKAVDRGRLC